MTDTKNAEMYLETCALGYSVSVQAGDADGHAGARAALHEAGVRLAAARGNLDAAERAELIALRRFRDGVVALREEMAAGRAADGGAIIDADASHHAVETIDALLYFAAPNAKEPT